MSEIITDKLTGKTSAGDVTITDANNTTTMSLQDTVVKTLFGYDQTVPEIDMSMNISSMGDDAQGKHSANFTTNMSAVTSVSLSAIHSYTDPANSTQGIGQQELGTVNTSQLKGYTAYNTSYYDCYHVYGQQWGDLA